MKSFVVVLIWFDFIWFDQKTKNSLRHKLSCRHVIMWHNTIATQESTNKLQIKLSSWPQKAWAQLLIYQRSRPLSSQACENSPETRNLPRNLEIFLKKRRNEFSPSLKLCNKLKKWKIVLNENYFMRQNSCKIFKY